MLRTFETRAGATFLNGHVSHLGVRAPRMGGHQMLRVATTDGTKAHFHTHASIGSVLGHMRADGEAARLVARAGKDTTRRPGCQVSISDPWQAVWRVCLQQQLLKWHLQRAHDRNVTVRSPCLRVARRACTAGPCGAMARSSQEAVCHREASEWAP